MWCIFATDGEVIEQRIATTRECLRATLGSRAPAKILVEASTESGGWRVHARRAWTRTRPFSLSEFNVDDRCTNGLACLYPANVAPRSVVRHRIC